MKKFGGNCHQINRGEVDVVLIELKHTVKSPQSFDKFTATNNDDRKFCRLNKLCSPCQRRRGRFRYHARQARPDCRCCR